MVKETARDAMGCRGRRRGRWGCPSQLRPPPPAPPLIRPDHGGGGGGGSVRGGAASPGPATAGSGERRERKALRSGRRRYGNQECNGDQAHER